MEFNTKLLHGKAVQNYADGAILPPISQTTAFKYASAEEHEKVFQHKAAGYAYSRVGNPTVAAFEQRMNELEGGNAAIACSSGMAAITMGILNMVCAGDEIIAGSTLYGGTLDLFEDFIKYDIRVRYVNHLVPEEIEPLLNEHTRLIFGEVIGNPGLEIMDVAALASYAHSKGLPLMVDSTTATPFLINPISLGADIVIHSSSKYINGTGNSISGVIIDSAKFKWDFNKFQALDGYRKFGPFAYTIRLRTDIWENMGGCLSPYHAYMNVIGLETLGLRVDRAFKNAEQLANALVALGAADVNYPTLHADGKRLADEQLRGYGGGILTFRAGSKERAYRIMNHLKYVTIASNIGDVNTLAIHPASTLYIRSTEEAMHAAGVYEDTIRISVGIEDVSDLIEDFRQAFAAADEA